MKLNRTWAMVVAIVMALTLSLSGTMAYLQDSDSDVNVMTLGNVDILQNEQQLAEDGVTLEEFKQNKDLYPGTEISKIVTVTNKGRSDAYFRTLIAFEDIESETFEIGFPISEGNWMWSWGAPEATIVVDGVTYQVYEALYTAVLKPGETSPASLTKVELAASATNEDMEALGYDYEILVLTQAVQTAGFDSAQAALDEAFGDVNATNAALWFGADFPEAGSPGDEWPNNNPPDIEGMVHTIEELKAAISAAEGPTTITLADGTYDNGSEVINVPASKDITIIGSKKAIVNSIFMVTGKLNMNGVTVKLDSTNSQVSQFSKTAIGLQNAGKVNCTNVTFDINLTDGTAITAWWSTQDGANIVVDNCVFNCNGNRPIRSDACVTVENCTFNDPYRYAVQMTSKSSTMADEAKAYVNFYNNTINAGKTSDKPVYGVQLEGGYGCSDLTINGNGNVINLGDTGKESAMYYCECGAGEIDHNTIVWNTEVDPEHEI